jgi:hypothetical protein
MSTERLQKKPIIAKATIGFDENDNDDIGTHTDTNIVVKQHQQLKKHTNSLLVDSRNESIHSAESITVPTQKKSRKKKVKKLTCSSSVSSENETIHSTELITVLTPEEIKNLERLKKEKSYRQTMSTKAIKTLLENYNKDYYEKLTRSYFQYTECQEDKEYCSDLFFLYEMGIKEDSKKFSCLPVFKNKNQLLFIKYIGSIATDTPKWNDGQIIFSSDLCESLTAMQKFITVESVKHSACANNTKEKIGSVLKLFKLNDALISLLDIEMRILHSELNFGPKVFFTTKCSATSAQAYIAPILGIAFLIIDNPSCPYSNDDIARVERIVSRTESQQNYTEQFV